MASYLFDRRLREIVNEWDCGWIFLLDSHSAVPEGLFSELVNSGYGANQLELFLHDLREASTERLVELALEDGDSNSPALAALQIRANDEVLSTALRLSSSGKPQERVLGVEILMRKIGDRYPEAVTSTITNLLNLEQNDGVKEALAYAAFHVNLPNRSSYLEKYVHSENSKVRIATAFSLGAQTDQRALQSLIVLSNDPDSEVRNWATLRIADMKDVDAPEIRDALFARTYDDDEETKHEAIFALAKRHDPQVLKPLLTALQSGDVWELAVKAAAEMADPTLYPVLVELRESRRGTSCAVLNDAIDKCQSQKFLGKGPSDIE